MEEAKCTAETASEILENGSSTMLLAKRIGLQRELDQFNKIQSDSTVSCDSLKKAWSEFSDLVYKKSK